MIHKAFSFEKQKTRKLMMFDSMLSKHLNLNTLNDLTGNQYDGNKINTSILVI